MRPGYTYYGYRKEWVMTSEPQNKNCIDNITGDLAKTVFYINDDTLDTIRKVSKDLKIPAEIIKAEYVHLRFFMIELALSKFAENIEKGEYFMKQFYEKAVFCLFAPELFAEHFLEASHDTFWKEQEHRNHILRFQSLLESSCLILLEQQRLLLLLGKLLCKLLIGYLG